MTDHHEPDDLLLGRDELLALKFAAHRQLSRWANSQPLGARKQARRDALLAALRVLDDRTLAHGCHLHPTPHGA